MESASRSTNKNVDLFANTLFTFLNKMSDPKAVAKRTAPAPIRYSMRGGVILSAAAAVQENPVSPTKPAKVPMQSASLSSVYSHRSSFSSTQKLVPDQKKPNLPQSHSFIEPEPKTKNTRTKILIYIALALTACALIIAIVKITESPVRYLPIAYSCNRWAHVQRVERSHP